MGKATDPPHVDLPAIVRSQRRGQRRRERHGSKAMVNNREWGIELVIGNYNPPSLSITLKS